jgi:hypothetical protein
MSQSDLINFSAWTVLLSLVALAGSIALNYWIIRFAIRGALRDHAHWKDMQKMKDIYPEEFGE